MKIFKKNIKLTLAFILVYGIVLRFYNLNWGAPFFFHPDERNIASSINQLLFPHNLNPRFFAYGTFPIYVNYFTGVLLNILELKLNTIFKVSFEQAIIIGRLYSAIISVGIIFFVYKIFKTITHSSSTLLLVVLSTSVGFIQFAHFATFEMWLCIFSLSLFYSLVRYYQTQNKTNLILTAVSLGLLISIKISSLIFLPITLFLILFIDLTKEKNKKIDIINPLKNFLLTVLISSLFFILTSPFTLINKGAFISSINYESNVALGTLPVFYTGSFYNTIPALFQLLFIFPFLINPLLTIIFMPALIFFSIKTLRTKKPYYFFLLVFFWAEFLSQVFLFAKWTRYMVPTLPFIYLIIFIALNDFLLLIKKLIKHSHQVLAIGFFTMAAISILYSFAFFVTVLFEPDTRFEALNFAEENIPSNSKILSETYDLGIVPLNSGFPNITLFNFYDLDSLPNKQTELIQALNNSDYIILPSQRVINSRIINSNKFPVGNNLYSDLLSGKLMFKQIYQTPCDILCRIIYMGNPVFNVELTANVFDRPSVFLFKKIK